jgi:hypothetical protein
MAIRFAFLECAARSAADSDDLSVPPALAQVIGRYLRAHAADTDGSYTNSI